MRERLVLGLGGTVDYEIEWDSSVVEALVEEYSITLAELSTATPVASERDLVVTILAFVRDGAGGERFVASTDIIESFASRFGKRITLGGTCVRAALAMHALGVDCTLHLVSIDDHVRRLLPPGSAYLCSAEHDSTDPHLIIQFGEGTQVRVGDTTVRSPHPNRIIYTNDPPNRELVLSDRLGQVLRKAEVFMVSGFNVIQDPGLLDVRLTQLKEHMTQLPAGAVVYYEDAGFHVPAFSKRVIDELAQVIDIHSMNEEELQGYLGRTVDLLDPAAVRLAVLELHSLVRAETLVVHTKYWSLALGARAGALEGALRGGITMASTRYLYGDGFTEKEYQLVSALPVNASGAEFARAIEASLGSEVRCVPAFSLVSEHPTTIGLGDTFAGGFIAALAQGG